MAESHDQLQVILERTREIGTQLARDRCFSAICGLSKVVVEVVETPKAGGSLAYFDTLHGVACTQRAGCYFAQHPLEITEVVREAAQQVWQELNIGSSDVPKREVPKDRTAIQPARETLIHVEYHLETLHSMCQRDGLSEEIEAMLRADLEQERDLLTTLPPDSPLHQVQPSVEAHLERVDARNAIIAEALGEPEPEQA